MSRWKTRGVVDDVRKKKRAYRICRSAYFGWTGITYLLLCHVTVANKTRSSDIVQHSTNSILDGLLDILITQLVPMNFVPINQCRTRNLTYLPQCQLYYS